jgi:integrase
VAHIQKGQRGNGEVRYYVRWRFEDQERVRSFRRARDAETFRRQIEHDDLVGVHVDPAPGDIDFGVYAEAWLEGRRRNDGRALAPRTRELYRYQLDRFLLPALAKRPLNAIRTEDVRKLHSRISDAASPLQAAKAYRLLRVILNTAVEDDRITVNPCKVRGAGIERSAERPFVDADLVLALAASIDERYCALVLLAGFGGLRLGELLGLRRSDVDTTEQTVSVHVQTVELKNGTRLTTAPKTEAGRRVVSLPAQITAALSVHLHRYTDSDSAALVFTGPNSDGLRRATFYKEWDKARKHVGLDDIHLHDFRHAAGTLAAQTGATTRELMARLGHATPAAALRYQHAATRRDTVIAAALDAILTQLQLDAAATTIPLLRGTCGAQALPDPEPPPGYPFRNGPLPGYFRERATGIEPAFSAWEADVLPLNYARVLQHEHISRCRDRVSRRRQGPSPGEAGSARWCPYHHGPETWRKHGWASVW